MKIPTFIRLDHSTKAPETAKQVPLAGKNVSGSGWMIHGLDLLQQRWSAPSFHRLLLFGLKNSFAAPSKNFSRKINFIKTTIFGQRKTS